MDENEFIKEVSSSEVLTTDEAFNIILQIKGSTPRRTLPFSSVERNILWKQEFFRALSIVNQGTSSFTTRTKVYPMQIHVPFQITYCKKDIVLVKSIFMINPNDCALNNASIQFAKRNQIGILSSLKNRFYLGIQLCEVEFPPHVTLKTNDVAVIRVEYQGNNSPVLLQGQRIIGDPKKGHPSALFGGNVEGNFFHFDKGEKQGSNPEDVAIFMQNVAWHLVVGFKYKVR